MKPSRLLLLVGAALFLSGCAQKVTVMVLEPAQISAASSTKSIAVTPFHHDTVSLADKIEAALSNQKIDKKPYFTVINRTDLNKIIDEQKIQNSGLTDESAAVEAGNLLGVQAIISGSVGRPSLHDNRYYVTRTKCQGKGADQRCWEVQVTCIKRTVDLSSQIRMINVATGEIIYADNVSRQQSWSRCADDSKTLPTTQSGAQYIANSIANDFAYKLTPHYRRLSVTLLKDPDLDYSDEQEKLLESALVYIKQSRYDKAEELLQRLIESTASQSYLPFYNIGVIYEARGDFNVAQEYYMAADQLTVEPVNEISRAVLRIAGLIDKEQLALKQISQ